MSGNPLTEVLTSMCARLYGRRSAARRAAAAVVAIENEPDEAPGRSVVIRAYLFALDPTEAAGRGDALALRRAAGRLQLVPARVRANWAQRAAEQTYGLTGDQLTPWINTSAYSLRKAWNAAKRQVAPWWAENSKEAYASGLREPGDRAGQPRGRPGPDAPLQVQAPRAADLPVHHRRVRPRPPTGATSSCPVIGVVRTHESTRKLARQVDAGTARIRSATLTLPARPVARRVLRRAARRPTPRRATGGRVVGVDLGIKSLAVLSTGEHGAQPAAPRPAQLRSCAAPSGRCARRRGPDRRTRVEPSHRWRKARARADRGPHPGGEPAPRRHPPAHHPPGPRPRRDRDRGPARGRHGPQPAPGPAHRRRELGGDPPPAHLQDRARRCCAWSSPTAGSPARRPARDAARRKPSWPCPSGTYVLHWPAASSSTGTRTPPGQPGRSGGRHARELRAGAARRNRCQTARLAGRQSDRHGKSPAGLNVTVARRWLDDRDRTSRFIGALAHTGAGSYRGGRGPT